MVGNEPEKGRKPTDWALMHAEFREFGTNSTCRNLSLSRRAN